MLNGYFLERNHVRLQCKTTHITVRNNKPDPLKAMKNLIYSLLLDQVTLKSLKPVNFRKGYICNLYSTGYLTQYRSVLLIIYNPARKE